MRNFEFSLEAKSRVILRGNWDHVVPMLMEPWIVHYNGPVPYEELSSKHKTLVKMNYVLITSEVLSRLDDLFILRALIVMIVWTCSYRDVWSFYRTDVVVRWFLGECKSEIHRRAKKFSANIKPVFNENWSGS